MSVEPKVVRQAVRQAEAAAGAAGVSVRQATPGDLAAAIGLFERTWGVGRSPDDSMLRALDFAGNTVLVAIAVGASGPNPIGATAGDPIGATAGDPIGASLGFLGWTDGIHLHSHMTAVGPGQRGGGVGYALKLYQRALCLEHGIADMRWTFDPLIRRNAHFNLVKLGAEVVRFWPDFYGRLDDDITGSDRSDRFEVRWRLDSPRTLRALAGELPPAWSGTDTLRLDGDFERLRAAEPAEAARCRDESRTQFRVALSRGLRPELTENKDYIFTTDAADSAPRPA
ncbi:hypothetical protein E3T28_00005 [Cryobacterium sinapicolor]|uniref:N-acetyltransferase domain-containing protein n=1 Tax=Cryobacterium sinapicolor TaxID=1259236 RepID=A0ABY2JIN9_9MICO|nr:hypothetical protein [Cryobacterium sinapicolor]TFD06439.1 hypothetical protein E3T28_00005 [Cryobacterium sinapicolor]